MGSRLGSVPHRFAFWHPLATRSAARRHQMNPTRRPTLTVNGCLHCRAALGFARIGQTGLCAAAVGHHGRVGEQASERIVHRAR